MKRFSALIKDTWWVWIILLGGGTTAGIFLSPIFFTSIPISFFSFFYFAMVRYGEDGKPKGVG